MRYTLSVLTAACLLALGQPAWSSMADTDLQQRARMAVLSLPDVDRCCAAQLLLQWQAVHAQPSRSLALGRIPAAMQTALQQYYGSQLHHHVCESAVVALHWSKPAAQDLYARPALVLDSTMLQRWTQALVSAHAQTDSNSQISL